MRPVDHIEFHDAVLESITVGHQGAVTISFSHLNVFSRKDERNFEIWQTRASLRLEGVTRFSILGRFAADSYVSEGTVLDALESEIRLVSAETLRAAKSISLLVAGEGATIESTMVGARIGELEYLEHVENWEGPL